MLSDITRSRLRKFKAIKRAYYSFWILTGAFLLSLFSEQLANDRPLVLLYGGRYYFPTLRFYSGETFGGPYKTEADYTRLRTSSDFHRRGGWMLLPLIPHDPLHPYLDLAGSPPHPPSSKHLLGTDSTARDILARLIHGFRLCMAFSLSLTITVAILGITVGALQGYVGGKVDLVCQRFIEVWSALPFLYVVILIGSVYGQSFGTLLFVMALFQWIGLSYYMRGEVLRLKEQTYVRAARAMGASHVRLLFRQILPNGLTPVLTILPFTLVAGISSLTALDFLGFGLPPPTPSWGEMTQDGLRNLQAPWISISAVVALFVTLLLASFVGEGARAAFDPKSLNRMQ